MRIEEVIAQALDKVDNNRYLLSLAVSKRSTELSKGSKPLISLAKAKNMKFVDIALSEIAKGLIKIS